MSDPISKVKSSGGTVDAEFIDQYNHNLIMQNDRALRSRHTNTGSKYVEVADFASADRVVLTDVWSDLTKDFFATNSFIRTKPISVSPGAVFYIFTYI